MKLINGEIGGKALPHHGGNGKILGGIPHLRHHHDDGLETDRTGKPAKISESSIYLWQESHKEFGAQFIVIISVTDNSSSQSPTGCVKSIPPNTENSMSYGYDENDNNNMSDETKCETNYSINNK